MRLRECALPGRVAATLLLALAGSIGPGPARAVPFDDRPKLLMHLKPTTTKNQCTTYGSLTDCAQAVTRGQVGDARGPFYYAYVLVVTGALRGAPLGGNDLGIGGAQFGIRYDAADQSGVDVFAWNLCATIEFPMSGWPASGTGTLITWDTTSRCQKNEVGVAGYFYCGAYSTDAFWLTARPVDGYMKVADCEAQEIVLDAVSSAGMARFTLGGDDDGCNPCTYSCFQSPVQNTTWSRIKSGGG